VEQDYAHRGGARKAMGGQHQEDDRPQAKIKVGFKCCSVASARAWLLQTENMRLQET